MRKVAAVIVAVASVGLIAACSGSTSSSTPPVQSTAYLRGTVIPTYSCHATSDGHAVELVPDRVIAIRLCPLASPIGNNPRISLTPEDPRFVGLVRALSVPDESAFPEQVCPEYAELLQPIIASDGSVAVLVHVPVDGCNHSLPSVRTALSALTNG